MRLILVVAAILAAAPAWAQQTQPGTTTLGEARPRAVPVVTDAPVPSVQPPSAQTGEPSSVPDRIAPPGAASLDAGPANATPFSGGPSGAVPSNPADSTARGSVSPGSVGGTPNLSK